MKVVQTPLAEVLLIEPAVFGDSRGYFMETWNAERFRQAGIAEEFVQDNQSRSLRGVLRGLHYQEPNPQGKLVRCPRGALFDVAVDIRRGSPTFGRHVTALVSAENWRQVYVPVGFAHGFVTLEPNTEVLYKVSAFYSPQHERGIRWNDPALGIAWGVRDGEVVVSPRDLHHPPLASAQDLF